MLVVQPDEDQPTKETQRAQHRRQAQPGNTLGKLNHQGGHHGGSYCPHQRAAYRHTDQIDEEGQDHRRHPPGAGGFTLQQQHQPGANQAKKAK